MKTESALDPAAHDLRDAYDAEVRARLSVHNPALETVEQLGPIVRKTVTGGRGFIAYRDLNGLVGDALDRCIAEHRDHFAALGASVEWKYHSYDTPADLPERLTAAGFIPEAAETLALGEAADLAIASRLPENVTLRELSAAADLERVRLLEEAVWGFDHSWLPEALAAEIGSATDPVVVIGAENGEDLVCAAWVRLHNGTRFASLWGGSTMPDWRGKGIYRATVARRAQLALSRGFSKLQVDSSPDSAQILTRLGMTAVAQTVPYVWHAPTAA